MTDNKNEHVVIAVFTNEDAADPGHYCLEELGDDE